MKKQIIAASVLVLALATPAVAAPMDYNNDAGSTVTNDKTAVDTDSTTMSDGVNTTTQQHKMVRHRSSSTAPSVNNNTLDGTDSGQMNGNQ